MKVLHIASWYPNPWDSIEGNFIRDQLRVFRKEVPSETVVVQVRPGIKPWPVISRQKLEDGTCGYFLLARIKPGKLMDIISTFLLIGVFICKKVWRFDALHFHIAYPLLMHSRIWNWLIKKPILISEHWSAYHFNFYLPENSNALRALRKPFQQGYPVFSVSEALLADIKKFSKNDKLRGFVLPNVVPIHGHVQCNRKVPVLFAVNRWVPIKNPLPMLEGLNQAAKAGLDFELVIGGYGEMLNEMTVFVRNSALNKCTTFLGKMTKHQIASQLTNSDGYLFSSNYETFSIACAEALGAGVPLIGPHIPAIAEYAGNEDWLEVPARDGQGWKSAIHEFVQKWNRSEWKGAAIAERAATRFSEKTLRTRYRAAMLELGMLKTI